ncbi:MAG: hypothetical protein DMD49_12780 [Gemmatimonadetes bacterium]|nr:MAG: hypothetical protein DMD49_12780 [Gemmatimonadota bacterium]
MVVGNDEKVVFDAEGNRTFVAPGKDTISIVDITDREAPKILVSFPVMNSIFGPPTNRAITPDERLAIVANSVDWVQDGANWKPAPDNKLYVFDLKASPPKQIATVEVGKQPSGLAINRAGDLALIANRNDKSISVLSIQGNEVKLIDTVTMGDEVASVAITPDGKRALATKFPAHKIALLEINGQKVTDTKHDMPVGLWPYNIGVTPDGKIGISADNGNAGAPDGHVDTVSIIDLESTPPRVIDRVVVGDAPEGFAISPKGDLAVAVLLGGAAVPKSAWFNYTVAEPAIAQGLTPDAISSDIHAVSINTPGYPTLPWVMSKFLNMGLSLEDVVAKATVEPAKVIGRVPGLGTLQVGAPADVAIFDLVDGPVEFVDTRNHKRSGTRKLVPALTVRGGRPFGRPPLPIPFLY